jgi:hypothetical protein
MIYQQWRIQRHVPETPTWLVTPPFGTYHAQNTMPPPAGACLPRVCAHSAGLCHSSKVLGEDVTPRRSRTLSHEPFITNKQKKNETTSQKMAEDAM